MSKGPNLTTPLVKSNWLIFWEFPSSDKEECSKEFLLESLLVSPTMVSVAPSCIFKPLPVILDPLNRKQNLIIKIKAQSQMEKAKKWRLQKVVY
jgi:hypothetical protein